MIIEGSAQGIVTFSFFFWSLFTLTALIFGRAACGYICPLGAIQETKDRMAPKKLARIKYLRVLKCILAIVWVGAIVYAAISAGGYKIVNLLYNTESGVSVDSAQGWFTYFAIVIVVLLPVFFIGKRGFCHYFCPWGVLNIAGTRIKNFFRWPSLNLKADSEKCKQCQTCDKNCPMSLEVSKAVQSGSMDNTECILCSTCVDNCPNGVIKYSWCRP
ncbi:4Fe-4S binding protein [Chloroflexota bacterium]